MRYGIIAVALLSGAGLSSGAEKAANVSVKAAPESRPGDDLKALAGSWSCDGMARGAQGAAQTYKARFANKWDLAGSWLSVRYDQTATKAPALGTGGYLGWDANGKRYLYLGVDSTGGWVTLSVPGWNGSSLTLVGHRVNGETKVPVRYTFTKGKTERDMMFAVEVQDAVKWNLESQDTCRR
jgi:hypothetical protein